LLNFKYAIRLPANRVLQDSVDHLVTRPVGRAPVHMRHRLESVKILPPRGPNRPELYGAITAQAVTRPEVNAPQRPRVFSMAVTATDERDRGQPTSWSAAIDALAAGRTFDPSTQGLVYLDEAEEGARRLFILSAGNVDLPRRPPTGRGPGAGRQPRR
jgi:hypothetical protein